MSRPAIVNGRAGAVVVTPRGVFSVMACTVVDGRMTEMDLLLDPEKLARVKV
jgi:RNA polymerase sigma-70 factor (ECF subfamily)